MTKVQKACSAVIVAHFILTIVLSVHLGRDIWVLIASNVHFAFGVIMFGALFAKHIRYNIPVFTSAPSVFYLIHCNYFILSALKYYAPPGYLQFRIELSSRFIGSLVIMGSIWICYILISRWLKKNRLSLGRSGFDLLNGRHLALIVPSLALACAYFVEIYLSIRQGYKTDIYSASYISIILNNIGRGGFVCLVMVLSFLSFSNIGSKLSKYLSFVTLLLFSVAVLYVSISIGARHILYFAVLAVLLGYSVKSNIVSCISCLFMFLLIEIVSVFALGQITSSLFAYLETGHRVGRYWNVEQNIQGMAYRPDLSDFAVSLALDDGRFWGNGPGMMADSVVNAIPRFLNPFKFSQVQDKWNAYLLSMGWESSAELDYPDTIFSMGYVAFGWVGFVLLLPLCIILLGYFQKGIMSIARRWGIFVVCIPILCGSLFYIEIVVDYSLVQARNILISMVIFTAIAMVVSLFSPAPERR